MGMNQQPNKQGDKQNNQRNDQAQKSPGRDQSGSDSRTQGRESIDDRDQQRRDQQQRGGSDTQK